MPHPKVPQEISNPISDNIQKLASLFPSAVKDGELDLEALKQELGQFTEVSTEKYELTWAGKQQAKQTAFTPILGRTLKYIPEDSKNPETTQNLYIEGDNLEVLKLLRQNYYGAVKIIYIDPPYNTGNDFIYNDNFRMTKQESDIAESNMSDLGERYIVNRKDHNRYHTNWLNMMYSRLRQAKNLLTEDGVIFVSCDEVEQPRLRVAMDEIFGQSNFVADMVWAAGRKNDSRLISVSHEYIVCYTRNADYLREKKNIWRQRKKGLEDIYKEYARIKKIHNDDYASMTKGMKEWYNSLADGHPAKAHKHYCQIDSRGVYFAADISWPGGGGPKYEVLHPTTKMPVKVPSRGWTTPDTQKMKDWIADDRVHFGVDETSVPCLKKYLKDSEVQTPYSVFYQDGRAASKRLRALLDGDMFPFPKDEQVIYELVAMLTKESDIILDFFSGSATSAHAVMQLNAEDNGNRKYIMVQLPETCDENSEAFKAGYKNICEIGKERIRRAGEKILEENKDKEGIENLDVGFKVFRVGDTNINWLHQDLRDADLFDHYNANASDKDKLDFTPGFTDLDVVYEIMLRQTDIPLSCTVEQLNHIGERIYIFADSFLVCLEQTINRELVDRLAAIEPLPVKFVFRDSAFDDDIALKDETFRMLSALIERNSGGEKQTYTVEFI